MAYLQRVILIVALLLPPALVVTAVMFDRRTRRGYALGLLTLVTVALDIWLTILYFQADQRSNASHTDNLGFIVVVLLYFIAVFYPALMLTLGGIAEAVIARQWWWLAMIAAAVVIPTAIMIAIGGALIPDFPGTLGISRSEELIVWLLLPIVATFSYALSRIVRPTSLPAAHT